MSHQTLISAKNPIFKNGKVFVTYGFMDPNYGGSHYGADLIPGLGFTEKDGEVVAIADGVVEYAKGSVKGTVSNIGHADALGNNIKIAHGKNFLTRYCHLKYGSLKVKAGDKVKKGDIIATIGNTGYSFGAHVHFEVRKNGVRIDPEPFITGAEEFAPGGGECGTGIVADQLNLRQKAGTSAKIALVIPKGKTVTFLDEYSWYCVKYGGKSGYVAANYVAPVSNGEVRTTSALNFRVNAGTDASKTAIIPANSVLKRADGHCWRQIEYDGVAGWVDAGYLVY